MPSFYYLANCLMKFLLLVLTRCDVRGRELVPRKGPLIVVANHLHNADPPLLGASLPRGVVFMAKEELFRSWGGWAVKAYGAFSVRKGQLDRKALRQASRVLERGLALGIFPEGTRSRTGCMQPALAGAALIAWHARAPILPVGIWGTEKLKGWSWLLRRPQVQVNIGQPFTPPNCEERLNRERLDILSQAIMGKVAELLPPSYRGVYGQTGERQPIVQGAARGD